MMQDPLFITWDDEQAARVWLGHPGDKNSTRPLVITSEIKKGRVILPKHSSYRKSALERITWGSHITPLCSLLHTLLKDKCMCLRDEWKVEVTRPAGQVQYSILFVPYHPTQTYKSYQSLYCSYTSRDRDKDQTTPKIPLDTYTCMFKVWLYAYTVCLFLFVWFDSLRPINNLSVKQGRVFLGWTGTKLG